MSADDSFAGMMARLRDANDQDAATQVFQRFMKRLIGLAKGRLDTWIRRKEDPEDVVQSVFGSFFAHCRAGDFNFSSWDSLWTCLTMSTVWKCGKRRQYYRAQRRDATREVFPGPGVNDSDWLKHVFDREPTPEEVVGITELVERFLLRLEDEDREIARLMLGGCTVKEIAGQRKLTEHTVERTSKLVEKRFKRMIEDDATPPEGRTG